MESQSVKRTRVETHFGKCESELVELWLQRLTIDVGLGLSR